MADKEYKKYDTNCYLDFQGARLCKDPEVREGDYGKMVRLTLVATSRKDNYSDLWIEVNVSDFHAEAASFLLKGDTVHNVRGRACLRLFGDDNEKFSLVCDRAEIAIPIELFGELKERGFEPGASKSKKGGKADKKPAAKGKPAGKVKPAKKPEPIEIDDDDDEDEDEEDDE